MRANADSRAELYRSALLPRGLTSRGRVDPRSDRPRRDRGRDRVPADLQHRPPDDRREADGLRHRRRRHHRVHGDHPGRGGGRGGASTSAATCWAIVAALAGGLARLAASATTRDFRFGLAVAVGSIPIAIAGLALPRLIEGPLRSLWVVGGGADPVELRRCGSPTARRPSDARRGRVQHARRAGHGADPVRRPDPRRLALGGDDRRRPVPRARPGHGDPDVVLPRDPGADRGRGARGGDRGRRDLRAGSAGARRWSPSRSASSSPTPRSPGCCATSPATTSTSSSSTGSRSGSLSSAWSPPARPRRPERAGQ